MKRIDIWLFILAAAICIGLSFKLVSYAEFKSSCRDPMNFDRYWSPECRE